VTGCEHRFVDPVPPPTTYSPDARRSTTIAFSREPGGDIWTMRSDGSDLHPVTQSNAFDSSPALSPDGRRIAFARARTAFSDQVDIFAMKVDGTDQTRFTTFRGPDSSPAWSGDGQQIAYASVHHGDSDIWVMNNDGSSPRDITEAKGADISPAWSPDGRRIAFAAYRHGNWDIYVMNADGSEQTRVTSRNGDDFSPSWSPNSRAIVYVHEWRETHQIATRSIYPRQKPQLVTRDRVDHFDPVFSPDGHRIAAARHRSRTDHIYVMRLDGSHIADLGAGEHPTWGVACFTPSGPCGALDSS
jgi:TolB protein